MTLKEFRKKKGFNQKQMAKEIGVSASYYCKVESNFQNPSYEFMVKLKKRFPDVIIDEVFFWKKTPAVIVPVLHNLFTSIEIYHISILTLIAVGIC